jgi:hypothetical protein
MSDNDILFDETMQRQVYEFMIGSGYEAVTYQQGKDDEYVKKPLYNIEMHRALFGNALYPELAEYFRDVKQRLLKDEQNQFGYHFSREDFYIYMVTHAYKHFIHGGVGIRNLLEGGYTLPDGSVALSAEEKMQRGRKAIAALATYRTSKDESEKQTALEMLRANFAWFGYGYLTSPSQPVPSVPLTFYGFRIMVMLGGYFIALFAGMLLLGRWIYRWKLALLVVVLTTPLAWLASQAGWVVAEVGRQPWAIQGLLPNVAAISRLDVGAVQTTFFIFLVLFTLLLVAELSIMGKAIAAGPEEE